MGTYVGTEEGIWVGIWDGLTLGVVVGPNKNKNREKKLVHWPKTQLVRFHPKSTSKLISEKKTFWKVLKKQNDTKALSWTNLYPLF